MRLGTEVNISLNCNYHKFQSFARIKFHGIIRSWDIHFLRPRAFLTAKTIGIIVEIDKCGLVLFPPVLNVSCPLF